MDKLEKNYCDVLTAHILDTIPSLRVIVFKSGKECISEWLENKGVNGTLSYCPKKKHYMFYYSEKK